MKNYIKLFSTVFIFTALVIDAYSQSERNVMWIHGLGGDDKSWMTNSAHHHNKYLMNCVAPTYSSGGLNDVAEIVKKKLNESLGVGGATNNKNIAVSHSFGGLVARNLEMQNAKSNKDQNFGGFITVHTANHGAALAKNVVNGDFKKNALNILDNVFGPTRNDPNVTGKEIKLAKELFGIDDLGGLEALLETLFFGSSDQSYDGLLDLAKMHGWFDPDKVKELVPDNPLLNELNNFENVAERITIYGGEEKSIFNRLFSSLTVKPGNKELDIVSDENADEIIDGIIQIYNINGLFNRTVGTVLDLNPFVWVSKIFGGSTLPFHDRARKWFDGADYIAGQLEYDYLNAIGALEFTNKTSTETRLTPHCSQKIEELNALLENFHRTGEYKTIGDVSQALNDLQNNPNCYISETINYIAPKVLPNDGVVLVESQKGAGSNNNGPIFENINCNHFEALNTKVLTKNFNDIFQNQTGTTPWFETPLR